MTNLWEVERIKYVGRVEREFLGTLFIFGLFGLKSRRMSEAIKAEFIYIGTVVKFIDFRESGSP